jgi:carboxypeptidase C (cathepsin A)
MNTRLNLLILAFFVCLVGPAFSQDNGGADKKEESKDVEEEPRVFMKSFTGRFNEDRVAYTVTAGETFLKDDKGEDTASIFTVAYTKDNTSNPASRPVTFVFNGGPGSASLWLHMGVFGPKRVVVPSDGQDAGAAPYLIEDNPLSILDVTDLVFIDPVGTGYSRTLGDAKGKDFWGLREDAMSVAEFMRIYLTKNGRWNSPKYVAGESYGTTRAAQLVNELQRTFTGVALNGVIMVSAILDFHAAEFAMGNTLPYISVLPTYAATAWYHDAVTNKPASLETFVEEARQFALNDYSVALLKGSRLTADEKEVIVEKLARFTGLSETYIRQTNLQVGDFRFMKQLLRDRSLSVGRFDSRYTGKDFDDAGEYFDNDASAYAIDAAFVTAVNDYLTRVLEVDFTQRYKVLDREPGRNWNWSVRDGGWPSYVNVAPHVGRGMRENKDLRAFFANGYYDLATPFFATENAVAANGIDPDRVVMEYYEAGHMMYTHKPSLEKLAADVRTFIIDGNR